MTKQDLDDIRLARDLLQSGEAKRLRESNDLTRAEVGAYAGTTQDAVALWESGRRCPRTDAARKLGAFLRELQAQEIPS